MDRVIDKDELPYGRIAQIQRRPVRPREHFVLPCGRAAGERSGPAHPYEEIIVVQDGRASFTVGGATIEATAGQIVVIPAGIPSTGPATSTSSRARRALTHYADRLGAL